MQGHSSVQSKGFLGKPVSGQTQILKSTGRRSSVCGKDQRYFCSLTQQVRVRAKRQVNLGGGETKQKECQESCCWDCSPLPRKLSRVLSKIGAEKPEHRSLRCFPKAPDGGGKEEQRRPGDDNSVG